MPIEDVKDMTWAEFQLRSFQYWEDQKREMMLFREVAYVGYCNLFGFSKQRPKSKEQFWPIGEGKKTVSNEALEALREIRKEYLKAKDGN